MVSESIAIKGFHDLRGGGVADKKTSSLTNIKGGAIK